MRKGKGVRTLISEIRGLKKRAAFHLLTFCHDTPLTVSGKKDVEKYVHQQFELWWNSWIEPNLADIEAKFPENKRDKDEGQR
jgi:hypothetical protein